MNTQIEENIAAARRNRLFLPILSLALEFVPAVCLGLIWLMNRFGLSTGGLIGFFLITTILAPLAGIIGGIVSLCIKERRCAAGIIISVIAILLPIVFVLTIMLLFQTGAIVFAM